MKMGAVQKIAIINSYLQGGHTEIAETESSRRFVEAGKNLSIDIRVFANSEDIRDFDPDFAVGITYQEGKFTEYPTYVSLNIAPSLIRDVPKFVRNILSFDGFMTVSPVVVQWLNQLCGEHSKKPHIAHAAFSVPRTEFRECDFKNATAMYMGTNWDGMRHKNLFELLKGGSHLKCYGPQKSWSNYPASLYGGEVAFDGRSSFSLYHKHGIGLCINHPDFDREGIASSRIFEIAASSALPICSENALTKSIYGDSVLYLGQCGSTEELAAKITEKVEWVRANAAKAQEMALEAHRKFNQTAAMENYINNLVEMHKTVVQENRYSRNTLATVEPARVTYIVSAPKNDPAIMTVLHDIENQTHDNIDVFLLIKDPSDFSQLKSAVGQTSLDITTVLYEGPSSNQMLHDKMKMQKTEWIGMLEAGDRIFPSHTAVLLKNHADFCGEKITPLSALKGLHLETSESGHLQDYMADQHWVASTSQTRLALTPVSTGASLACILFSAKILDTEFFKQVNFMMVPQTNFSCELEKGGRIHPVFEVTSSSNIDGRMMMKNEEILRNEIKNLKKITEKMKAELAEIYSSNSWVYTAFLRKFFTAFRRIKNIFFTGSVPTGG